MELNFKLTYNIPEELIKALGINEDTLFCTSYDKLIGEIMRVISEYPESEIGKPLGEEYLMGYYLQKTSLYTKRNTDNNEPEDNEQ